MAISEQVKTFDLTEVNMMVGTLPISGFQDGDAMTWEPAEDLYNMVSGADGEVARSRTNNKSGTLTFNLLYSSDANAVFQQMLDDDENNNTGIRTILIEDLRGGFRLVAGQAWVQAQPPVTFSKEMGTREWVLGVGRAQITHAGIVAPST